MAESVIEGEKDGLMKCGTTQSTKRGTPERVDYRPSGGKENAISLQTLEDFSRLASQQQSLTRLMRILLHRNSKSTSPANWQSSGCRSPPAISR
jgi:hypothetical protein